MKLSKLGYLILKDRAIKQKVAEAMSVTENTVYYWLKTDSEKLTIATVLDVISRETGLTFEQLLEHDLQNEVS